MKKVLTKIAILTVTVSLAACSTNTQNENTAIGAVTGGVVGGAAGAAFNAGGWPIVAGVAVGALVGGLIGHSMDAVDKEHVYTAVNSGQPIAWKNAKTHAVYKVKPYGHYVTVNGNPYCRKYTTTARMGGKVHRVHGTACRQSDGSWQAVNS